MALSALDTAMPPLSLNASITQDGVAPKWMTELTDYVIRWWIVLTIVGIPGNAMSLLITLNKDNRRISTCTYMTALALVDTAVVMLGGTHKLLIIHGLAAELMSSKAFLSFIWYADAVAAISSGLFLAEMSIDRAIAVSFPMKAVTICTTSRATKVIIATFVFEVIVHSQAFHMYTLPDPPNGIIRRELPGHLEWALTLFNTYMLLLGTIIPFAILTVSNIIIIIRLRRAATERKKLESRPTKQNPTQQPHITRMLLLTSTAFLFCSCPKRIWETFSSQYDLSNTYWSTRYWLEFWIFTKLWETNFAINFYIYFLGGGRKFRNDAKEVLTRCCKKST